MLYYQIEIERYGVLMNYGFIKTAAATPDIKVADCEYNASKICELIDEANNNQVDLIVFPELCLTGYTCSDLFWQSLLLDNAKKQLIAIARHTEFREVMAVIGLPFEIEGKLYNVAAVLHRGHILGMVPKKNLPNYSEFYEARHFTEGFYEAIDIKIGNDIVPCGMNILFKGINLDKFILGIEICEDLWVPNPPSIAHAMAGATVIANLSASDETTGKSLYRRELVSGQAARLVCGYVYSDAGEGESSTDLVFAGHNIIAENGNIINESERFMNQTVMADIDLDRIVNERRKMTTFGRISSEGYRIIEFRIDEKYKQNIKITRKIDSMPFVPQNISDRNRRCEEILSIQAMGLKKRLKHTNSKSAVIGISGGLDSTLALLVTVRAFDSLFLDRKDIITVTMPGFGTTDRTYTNAIELIRRLGTTLKEINISKEVLLHFEDIEHDVNIQDVTYENAQARIRTLLLMNLANQYGGLVIGTGDMSELALGWATYNGDHMSMYGVNASVPKTLVRHLVKYYSDSCNDSKLSEILIDVLDTPVSPELLPPENGEISQKTEDLVGPYELHDFYLYYTLRLGYTPKKVMFLAENAFNNQYDKDTILKWLRTFYRRFFAQQFKRSCLPDGPKVGSVAVSPRGDLRMPSDAVVREWLQELDNIE